MEYKQLLINKNVNEKFIFCEREGYITFMCILKF